MSARRYLGPFRRAFWNHVADHYPDVVDHGFAGSNKRHQTADENLRISLYVARQSVGIYLVRTYFQDPKLPGIVRRYLEPLRMAVGAMPDAIGGTSLPIEGGTQDRAQWDSMATWLHERLDTYQRVISRAA